MRVKRAWVLLVLVPIVSGLALVTGREMYYRLTYFLFAVLVLSALWACSSVQGISMSRYTRADRARVGHILEEHLSLRNASRLPKLYVTIHDESDLSAHHAGRVIPNLGAHQEYRWRVRTLCEQRGDFRLGPAVVRGGDPLGLFECRRELPQTGSVVIYPAIVPIRDFSIPKGRLPGGDALRRRVHHVTPNAAGVRDYVPGDSFSRIHWPSTARKDRLMVKEFELNPMSNVWIFLDMQEEIHATARPSDSGAPSRQEGKPLWKRMEEFHLRQSTEEYAVTAAASVANYFIQREHAVGLVAHGQRREIVQADREERQLSKLLETLAVLRAEGEMPFSQVLRAEAGGLARGTTVIAISPSVREQWGQTALLLENRGLRVVTILIDAASFDGPAGADMLKEHLLTAGMPTVLLRNGDQLSEALGSPASAQRIPVPLSPRTSDTLR